MIKTKAVKLANEYPEPFMITWDTGKRCNYNCTYCDSTRHDNYSSFHSLSEYLETFNFIKNYVEIYERSKTNPADHVNINFTGGEPTLNPSFFELVDQIKRENNNYRLSLTTNGAWNRKYTEKIKKRFSGITVSYHAESNSKLKELVIENILALKDTGIWLQVNVMLHADYFDECVKIYEYLKSQNIKVNPRPIGDGNEKGNGWFKDHDGYFRKTSHEYTQSQIDWFFNETGMTKNTECTSGDEFGRGCCGGRCIEGLVEGEWQPVRMIDTHFKNWHCSVNWYFLHIEQSTGLLFHHQTCQATFQDKKGPIGSLTNTESVLNAAKRAINNNTIIKCPNTRCGCGMCVPKAANKNVFVELKKNI